MAAERFTIPVNPLMTPRLMVEFADEPEMIVTVLGLADMSKLTSCTLTVSMTEWVRDALDPVTFTE